VPLLNYLDVGDAFGESSTCRSGRLILPLGHVVHAELLVHLIDVEIRYELRRVVDAVAQQQPVGSNVKLGLQR